MAFPRLGGSGLALNFTGSIGSLQPQSPGVFSSPAQGTNVITLNAGEILNLPAGTFLVLPGAYTSVQFQDPGSTEWRTINADTSLAPMAA